MRRMRASARTAGLAAIGAAALVAPFLVSASPAEALLIPKAELSIDKSVGSHRPTIELDPARSDTGENGHLEWVEDGLHLYTEKDADSCVSVGCVPALEQPEMRIAEFIETDTPMSAVGSAAQEPYFELQGPGFLPEYHLLIDLGSDGNPDVELVNMVGGPVPGLWHGYLIPQGGGIGGAYLALGTAPNQTNVGLLDNWMAVPGMSQGTVTAFGFEVSAPPPPGYLTMDATIRVIHLAGMQYSLARVYRSGVTAAPGETVSYKLVVTNGNSANSKAAQGVQVADVLPPDTTYVPGSLKVLSGGQWLDPSSSTWPCDFSNNMLTCAARTFAKGESKSIRFWATLDDSISTSGLPQSEGHWVDVTHDDTASSLNVGQTRTITALCPIDYMATDGGLLLDDAGSSADIVIESSRVTNVGGAAGWAVRATNLGNAAADVTVQVTCLAVEVGSSGGHTHLVDAVTMPMQTGTVAIDLATEGQQVQRSCPTGYTPYAPEFEVTSGIAVVRESYVVDNTWYWVIDHTDGTGSTFGISCLAPQTMSDGGHTADLVISTPDDTISVGPETQTEGIMACPADSNAIVGGYGGYTSQVRSLGAEPRGDRYMFRFYNEDWNQARNADIQVTCVGALTADEPTYKDVINTAYVTTTTKDRDYSDNASSAGVAVNGDPVAGAPSGVILNQLTATRTVAGNKTTALTLDMRCTKIKPCNFTVKAFSGNNLVASKTTSILALASKNVVVPTTGAGKNLAFGDNVVVKIKTTAGTTQYSVGIVS